MTAPGVNRPQIRSRPYGMAFLFQASMAAPAALVRLNKGKVLVRV